jgi:1,4-dihydroxy-2-naphthoate polyprenyltransferase
MKIKYLPLAFRLPFVTACALPALFAIVWCARFTDSFDVVYGILCIAGVILVHISANTINDYFDWNVSDVSNPHAGPFNGGSRSKLDGKVSRISFLIISLLCLFIIICIALFFIVHNRFSVLYFAVTGLLFSWLYSSPPFRLHSKGLGELVIFLAFGPVLCAAVCYVMTGTVLREYFFIGIPSGLATTAILWINQFPDHDADKAAGKHTLTVRIGLSASRYIYLMLIAAVYLSTVLLICFKLLPLWAALIFVLTPASVKALRLLFTSYRFPEKLLDAQRFTIQFQMLSTLIIICGVILGKWVVID